MKSINETVDKMLFPFATSLIFDKGLNREKIFHTEFNFIHNKIVLFKVVSDKPWNKMKSINETVD